MVPKKCLSLCMITNDDENYILKCIKEISEIVDEIVVVDIGSKDQTVDMARQAGASVYQVEWNNSFSEVKNICLDHADGRWILFLQPNEVIANEQIKELKTLLDNPNAEGYLLYIDHYEKNDRIMSPIQSLRLFRNRKEYRYKHRAFERIPDEVLSNVHNSFIRIIADNDSNLLRGSQLSTLLLEEELLEHPDDSYLEYIYGLELLNQHRYDESISYLKKALKNVNYDYMFVPHLFKCLSWSYILLQRHSEALEVLEEGIEAFPFYTDFLILRGELFKQLKQYVDAVRDLESCLKIREQPNLMVPVPEIGDAVIFEILGEVYELLFNYQQALICYQEAYELDNANNELLYKIGKLCKKTDTHEVMENLLNTAIEQNNSELLMTLIDIKFQLREYKQALACIEYFDFLHGKGDRTECIKYSCYLMLGEIEKAEILFSTVNKKSASYNEIVLKRIESHWFLDQWGEAELLIKEMDQIENIDNSIKNIYQLLQGLLTGKDTFCTALTQNEYDTVFMLHKNFLWLGQEDKGETLLHILLNNQEYEQIALAESWADRDNLQMIQTIYRCLSDKEKQVEFKLKILEQLLHSGHIKTAHELIKLGDSHTFGELEYILWSIGFMEKLEKWISKVSCRTTSTDTDVPITSLPSNKPDKALLAFYNSLRTGYNINESTLNHDITELACSEIHVKIGHFYEKEQKKGAALLAYLRALQWDPLNELAQEKISSYYNENLELFNYLLEEKVCTLEGSWFNHIKDFIGFIYGFIHFKNQEFEQALVCFSKINEAEACFPISHSYVISSLLIIGNEAEAVRVLDEKCNVAQIVPYIFKVCTDFVLCRLNEGQKKYPLCELIVAEIERIRNISSQWDLIS